MGFAKALKDGKPVVFTGKDKPEVVCDRGKEREALELLEQLGIIRLIRPVHVK